MAHAHHNSALSLTLIAFVVQGSCLAASTRSITRCNLPHRPSFTRLPHPDPVPLLTPVKMATAEASGPINGNYASQGYDNSYANTGSNFAAPQQSTSQPAQQAPASEIPKDEVGWYFVEQYYTTLSKSPDRLYVSCLIIRAIKSHHTDSMAAFL